MPRTPSGEFISRLGIDGKVGRVIKALGLGYGVEDLPSMGSFEFLLDLDLRIDLFSVVLSEVLPHPAILISPSRPYRRRGRYSCWTDDNIYDRTRGNPRRSALQCLPDLRRTPRRSRYPGTLPYGYSCPGHSPGGEHALHLVVYNAVVGDLAFRLFQLVVPAFLHEDFFSFPIFGWKTASM